MQTARERALKATQDNMDRHYSRIEKGYANSLSANTLVGNLVKTNSSGTSVIALPNGSQLPLTSRTPPNLSTGNQVLMNKPQHSDKWWGS